jgi:hypothetical protein
MSLSLNSIIVVTIEADSQGVLKALKILKTLSLLLLFNLLSNL